MANENENPLRGCVNAAIVELVCLVLFVAGLVALTGCVGQGSWDLHGELMGMKYQLAMTNTPAKPSDPPVTQTFDDWFKKWWESLWQEPAQALTQADHRDTTIMTTIGKPEKAAP